MRRRASLARRRRGARRQVAMPADHEEVFLLGAGFARAVSPTMPLLQDLADRVRDGLGSSARIPAEVTAMMEENFAHALSYLENEKPWVTAADNLRHRALYLEMSHAIARDLDQTVARAGDKLGANAPRWLTRLI